jgi:hypothetical protein
MIIGNDKGNPIDDLVDRPNTPQWKYYPGKLIQERDTDLLDEFAKAALTGMLASEAGGYSIYNREKIGESAYDIAANMMSERARRREVEQP